jgi:hypothetical protein
MPSAKPAAVPSTPPITNARTHFHMAWLRRIWSGGGAVALPLRLLDRPAEARKIDVTPHVAQYLTRHGGKSAIDARTTRHAGYRASQCLRKRVEEPFGWAKTVGHIRQTVFRGLDRVNMQFLLTMAPNNLVRMRGLLAVRSNVVNQMAGDRYVRSPVNRQPDQRNEAPKHKILGCQRCAVSIRGSSLTVSLPISTAC